MLEVDNGRNVLDSRDVIERIEELELGEEELGGEEAEELKILRELAEEASGYSSDWEYGEALIRYSYFREYAEELAEDMGVVDVDTTWPLNHIDWDAAVDELQLDYTLIDYKGVDYWIRCC